MRNAPPMIIEAPMPVATLSATVIFLHGLSDDACGFTGMDAEYIPIGTVR